MANNQSGAEKAPVTLPSTFDRERIIDIDQLSVIYNYSKPHIRRLYRTGKIPRPFKIGGMKNGWRVGTILDHIDAASGQGAA